jgi:hypothetical protein
VGRVAFGIKLGEKFKNQQQFIVWIFSIHIGKKSPNYLVSKSL